jgi:hypothetical protein
VIFISFPIQKLQSPTFTVPSLSHLTSSTTTQYDLYVANFLAGVIIDPALYRLLTFQVSSNTSLLLLRLRDTSSKNTPLRRSEWGSSLLPDCFVSGGSISHV